MWRDDLEVSRKVIDIKFATKNLGRWFKTYKKHDAAKMLQFVIRRLIDEEIPLKLTKNVCKEVTKDSDVEEYYNASKLSHMFQILMTRRQQCSYGHQTSSKVTRIGF